MTPSDLLFTFLLSSWRAKGDINVPQASRARYWIRKGHANAKGWAGEGEMSQTAEKTVFSLATCRVKFHFANSLTELNSMVVANDVSFTVCHSKKYNCKSYIMCKQFLYAMEPVMLTPHTNDLNCWCLFIISLRTQCERELKSSLVASWQKYFPVVLKKCYAMFYIFPPHFYAMICPCQ